MNMPIPKTRLEYMELKYWDLESSDVNIAKITNSYDQISVLSFFSYEARTFFKRVNYRDYPKFSRKISQDGIFRVVSGGLYEDTYVIYDI